MKASEVMIQAPRMKARHFHQRLPPTENSATIISVQAMYKKVPAAIDDIITFTMSPAPEARIPIAIPRGDASEKSKISLFTMPKSLGKVLTSEIPSAEPAAPLWIAIATTMSNVFINPAARPSAIPSKIACTESANISM